MAITGTGSGVIKRNTMSGSSTDENPAVKPPPKRRVAKIPEPTVAAAAAALPPPAAEAATIAVSAAAGAEAAAAGAVPVAGGSGAGGGGGGDSEGSDEENVERGSEVCQIGGDMCVVPAQLFDLPSLQGVLSLNTWNYSLTEEERERLLPFLPPFDEEDVFKDTIRELLGGGNFHFGSPITTLFDRLKKGLCHPRVSQYREGLKYLQRKEHYHLIRQYHNQMVNLFLEMQQTWESFPEADFEERPEIWHKRQSQPQQLLPPLPVKPKRVMRKPATAKSVVVQAAAAAAVVDGTNNKRLNTNEGITAKRKAPELPPKKGKISLQRSIPIVVPPVLAPATTTKKKPEIVMPTHTTVGSKGFLKIKTVPRVGGGAAAEGGPSKRFPEMEKPDKGYNRPRLHKPAPKGVLKVISKGKGVMKKTDGLVPRSRGPPPLVDFERGGGIVAEDSDDDVDDNDQLEDTDNGRYKHKHQLFDEEMDRASDPYALEDDDDLEEEEIRGSYYTIHR
jgi:nuclear factor related to kappa-B-binding protein